MVLAHANNSRTGAAVSGTRSETIQLSLWVAAILLFGFGDTFTSLMVFGSGGSEANMLLGAILRIIGPTVGGFLLVKVATTVGAMLLARNWPRLERLLSLVMLAVGIYLVAQNTAVIMRL